MTQWLQCTLRINHGGLGIGISEHTAHSAYMAPFLRIFNDLEQILPNLRDPINNKTLSTIMLLQSVFLTTKTPTMKYQHSP